MKNAIGTLLTFSALGLSVAALPALGGELQPIHVNVPFSFSAGKTVMPAGEYTVYENESHLVTLRGNKNSVLLLSTAGSEAQDAKTALGFERTASGLHLRSIRAAGHPMTMIPVVVGEK
jgi:hypothetical protein